MIWSEPARGILPDPSHRSLPGIEQARALARGQVHRPPLFHLTGITVSQVGAGTAVLSMPTSPWLDYGDGTIEIQILLQEAILIAVLASAPPASEVIPASLAVNNLRTATMESRSLVARARVIHGGPRFTVAEVLVEDAQGRAVAHGSGSVLIRPLDPPPPPPSGAARLVEEPAYATPDPPLRPLPDDVVAALHAVKEHGWFAALKNNLEGEIPTPPSGHLLGLRVVDIDDGRVALAIRTSDWLRGSTLHVSAGVVAYLVNGTLAVAASTLCPPTHALGIVDTNLSFLRPAPLDHRECLGKARVVHEAGELLVATGEIVDSDGNLVAVARQTTLRIERRRRTAEHQRPERVLVTVVFTDIVGSTRRAEELGDAAWETLLAEHHAAVRSELEVWKGKEVKTTGDGFLATFDSPTRAVQWARSVRDALHRLKLEIRAGIHTGECEVTRTDVAGVAVHVAARVQAAAGPGEILVSGTVRDLAAGSGLRFAARGRHALRGIEGEWQLFSLE